MDGVNHNKEITLAIFPFENLTEGNGLDVFCRSFQIDLTTELSRFRQFRIVSHESIRERDENSADYLIRGSFHYINERLRINAQLVNNHGNHITWAERFEGTKESILSIQEGVLTKVVSTLQQQLNYDLLSHFRKKTGVNITAYEHWLYGMEELKKGTLQSDEKARLHFQHAIELDPTYSLAYSGMSMTYFNEWSCQLWERWDVSQVGAYEWARKAIELDEQNYVAACVLGRVHLYEEQYNIAEHYLRRALKLNPNDVDNVIQIASCFVFLGYITEAEALYEDILRRDPLHSGTYHHVASLIAFEAGQYEKCIALGANSTTPWVDFPAMMAAAYYKTGDLVNMRLSWDRFLTGFQKKILKGNELNEAQALQWIINVNPYKGKTNMQDFWQYIGGKQPPSSSRVFARAASLDRENYIIKENDRWQICFDGEVIYLTEVKGFYDLTILLSNPEKQFHCTELAGGGIVSAVEPVFDEKAKRHYQKKILELQEEIKWSEDNNDLQRTTSLQKEYDEIVDHLSISLGIGKRVRKVNDPLEKARSAVTWRIRTAIQKINKENTSLGKHLSQAVKTGLFCSYNPERPVRWLLTGTDN